ncbi:MAG: plasmid pRiA4b ORF-3 family protein [candidate division KSB1 bacterium]|nr:plasmid pRiA4b ORF-3 family protein [candidate division KSB1 bacterium]
MTSKQTTNENVFQIKVTLRDSKPPIWRRLLISGSNSLFDLHKIIQLSMGWTNSHLHQFIIKGDIYSIPFEEDLEPVMDVRDCRIEKIALSERSKFVYEYDFGDSWIHDIVVEKILPVDPDIEYPLCLAGQRACPPEDVGGIWGFEEFLEAMKDPEHEEHESYVEWWGGIFDPEAINLDEINQSFQDIDQLEWW